MCAGNKREGLDGEWGLGIDDDDDGREEGSWRLGVFTN